MIDNLYIHNKYTGMISSSSWNYNSQTQQYYAVYELSDFYILGENQNYIKMKLDMNNSIVSVTSIFSFTYSLNYTSSVNNYSNITNNSGESSIQFSILTPDYRHIDGGYCVSNYTLTLSFVNLTAPTLVFEATIKCGESSMPTF